MYGVLLARQEVEEQHYISFAGLIMTAASQVGNLLL